jgi:hypothetical protein
MNTRFLLTLTGLAAAVSPASAQSTVNATNRFAWSANTGWINLRPSTADGVVAGEFVLSGYAWAANTGWMHLGDGTPANRIRYSNTSVSDFGVNHDGAGNLTGFAWSANTGWVNLSWAGLNDPNRPRLDLLTGGCTGFAWGANTGWVNLGSGFLTTDRIFCPDTDGDGMGDGWEEQHFGNLTAAGVGTDRDQDGQSDAAEYLADTDPDDAGEWLQIVSHTFTAGHTQVRLQFATTRPTRLYRIQGSTSLSGTGPGAWEDLGTPGVFAADPGTTTSRTVTLPGGARQFLRVVPVKPLQP